ncbi:PREDICTED: glutathione synthetase-like [Ceratosolen solmsi marchali]|uniref:Glutathione synthetase n=1 Tax=Ceratosolen solmsi marchali TaxID=326594 RepID=A0AAJ6YMZ4_9HYME|nr:PREDICTED: glutathione synthetase-like [Ceratosolen solmsi marchali]
MQSCIDVNLSNSQLKNLAQMAKDWIIMHGAGMRSKNNFNEDQIQIVPFLLLPSCYPRKEFESAKEVQILLNELMHNVAHDYDFLTNTLKNTIEVDTFTSKLFNIYQLVHSEGFIQPISLGLIRSDYLLHKDIGNKIKQVEVNMIASSFGGLAPIISEYHKFILTELGYKDKVKNIPENNATLGLSNGLIEAWKMYNNKKAIILFIVEDITYNILDQRAIEFKIYDLNSEIKIIRRSLTELIMQARLGSDKELFVDDIEVAVIYYRSGYQLEAYPSENEWNVRLLLERSRAIKCPSIQYHLAGTKKIQQELSIPGVLEKFISDSNKIIKIRQIFMGIYALDFNEDGEKAIAMGLKNSHNYVLKPQREGGGNNIYNDKIKDQLEVMKHSKDRTAWILMERIYPPILKNYLIHTGNNDLKIQEFNSELGVYGVVMGYKSRIIHNTQVGHILRTKLSSANEGGIIFGFGALDSPYIVN